MTCITYGQIRFLQKMLKSKIVDICNLYKIKINEELTKQELVNKLAFNKKFQFDLNEQQNYRVWLKNIF